MEKDEEYNVITIVDKAQGDPYTAKPLVYKAGTPKKLTGFASIYEEAGMAKSKDRTILLTPDDWSGWKDRK